MKIVRYIGAVFYEFELTDREMDLAYRETKTTYAKLDIEESLSSDLWLDDELTPEQRQELMKDDDFLKAAAHRAEDYDADSVEVGDIWWQNRRQAILDEWKLRQSDKQKR